jgi:hypothetical protein
MQHSPRTPVLALAAALALVGPPALAEEQARPPVPPEQFVDQIGRTALEALLQAMREALAAVPYAMPEINGQGDIIIRRLPPRPDAPRPPPRRAPSDPDQTST